MNYSATPLVLLDTEFSTTDGGRGLRTAALDAMQGWRKASTSENATALGYDDFMKRT
jgi:hypothetical protein